MSEREEGLCDALLRRGVSRRTFLKFSASMAAALALPASYAPRIASAVAAAPRMPVIWLRGQDCAGETQAFLRSADPSTSELMLNLLSIDYHETLMAPAGSEADASRIATMEKYPDGYFAVVEGGIPTADGGVYCLIGGRPFQDVVREVCGGALLTIAVGSCAFDGGSPGASGGPTGSVGVGAVTSNAPLVNLPGCPINVDNLTATIVHYLTFRQPPVTDSRGRPLFAYGGLVHNQCERRAHFEFGEFVQAWGDEAAQKGWCLYKMGCKGPETYANCPTIKFSEGLSWPVKAGTGCIGCTMPGFWDAMSPFYRRLQSPIPFGIAPGISPDLVGAALVGGIAAVTVVHGSATFAREQRNRALAARRERSVARSAATAAPAEAAATAETAATTEPEALPMPTEARAPAVAVAPLAVELPQPTDELPQPAAELPPAAAESAALPTVPVSPPAEPDATPPFAAAAEQPPEPPADQPSATPRPATPSDPEVI